MKISRSAAFLMALAHLTFGLAVAATFAAVGVFTGVAEGVGAGTADLFRFIVNPRRPKR